MYTMTSKLIILHFKGTIMFTHFYDKRMDKWQSWLTFSKLNANFPHLTGYFHLQIHAVFSMTNANAMSRCHNLGSVSMVK